MRPNGKDGKFRDWLERRRTSYVVGVPKSQAVGGDAGTSRADVLAADAPGQAWKRRSCGNDSKGPRVFDWTTATLPEDGTARYLLVHRPLTRTPRASWNSPTICAPADTENEELVRVAGSRWAVLCQLDERCNLAEHGTRVRRLLLRLYLRLSRRAQLLLQARPGGDPVPARPYRRTPRRNRPQP
jgi:hypothetical protein